MGVALRPEDFGKDDWDTVAQAGACLLGEVQDLAYHNVNPGEGWDPFAERRDTPAVIAEVRGHIERLEAAIKQARAEITTVEHRAHLAAARRTRGGRAGD